MVLALLVATVCLSQAPMVFAFTLQEVYDDFADNGRLDQSYSCEELRAAVGDATLNQYGDQIVLDAIKQAYNKQCSRNEFPFSGFGWTVAGLVAFVLLGAGFGLRKYARRRST